MTKGFWEPHTSSVDFCEQNYYHTDYIAELHNTWSSLVYVALATFGYFYSNPTKEARFSLMYLILGAIGVGSTFLHMTLHWLPQSSDEVPMLWLTFTFLFSLIELKSPIGEEKYPGSAKIILLLTFLQTVIYYSFRSIFAVFVFFFIVAAYISVFLAVYVLFEDSKPSIRESRCWLFGTIFFLFPFVGAIAWVVDMNLCSTLTPYYQRVNGMTLHILWHILSGYGTYLSVQFVILCRMQILKLEPKMVYYYHCLLVIKADQNNNSKE